MPTFYYMERNRVKTRNLKLWAVAIVVIAVAAGCPGVGGPQTETIISTASLDGDVTSAGGVTKTADVMNVGDTLTNYGSRGFVSFDVNSIAPPATDDFDVSSVTLKLTMENDFWDPITDLGNVVVELVEYGTSLDASDYSATAIGSPVVLATTTGVLVDFEADVTSLVQDYIASGDADSLVRWQFRLRPATNETDNDGVTDETSWGTAEYVDGYRPTLIVTYR
jgi:hypothetical protein